MGISDSLVDQSVEIMESIDQYDEAIAVKEVIQYMADTDEAEDLKEHSVDILQAGNGTNEAHPMDDVEDNESIKSAKMLEEEFFTEETTVQEDTKEDFNDTGSENNRSGKRLQ